MNLLYKTEQKVILIFFLANSKGPEKKLEITCGRINKKLEKKVNLYQYNTENTNQ